MGLLTTIIGLFSPQTALRRKIEQADRQIAAIDREVVRQTARGITSAQLASLRASRQHWIDVRNQAVLELQRL